MALIVDLAHNFWRLEYLGIFDKVNLIPVELSDTGSIVEALKISEAMRFTTLLRKVLCLRNNRISLSRFNG
jgi:hypothetical protein